MHVSAHLHFQPVDKKIKKISQALHLSFWNLKKRRKMWQIRQNPVPYIEKLLLYFGTGDSWCTRSSSALHDSMTSAYLENDFSDLFSYAPVFVIYFEL